MTIAKPAQPKEAKQIVHRALARRGTGHRALRGEPHVAAGLPLYVVAAQDVSHRAPLSKARKVGWNFPVVGGEVPGLALLLRKPSRRLAYAGLMERVLPRRVLRACIAAETKLKDAATKFEPRLLEIPALRLYALWLFAPRGKSRFVLLSQYRGALEVVDDIAPYLEAAKKRRP